MLILCACSIMSAWSQPFDPFQPAHPIVMGRGGSYTATASGYNAFFYNPAGFALDGELTVASTSAWAFMDGDMVSIARSMLFPRSIAGSNPRAFDMTTLDGLTTDLEALSTWVEGESPAVIELILQDATGDTGLTFTNEDDLADLLASAGTEDIIAFLEAVEASAELNSASYPTGLISAMLAEAASVLPTGYLRAGGQIGTGYLGKGIGLGLFANAEAVIDGTNILAATGTAYDTITFVGGFGMTFGNNLHVGLSLRPTILGYSIINAAPLIGGYFALGTLDLQSIFANSVYFGSGLGIDAGVMWELGPFRLGLSLKDVFGTRINYRTSSFSDYYQALITAALPAGTEIDEATQAGLGRIPMKVNVGFEFHPNLGVTSYLFDPSVSVDLLDTTSAIRTIRDGGQVTGEQILGMLNFGGQINLFRFLAVRAGYAGGYMSAGVGLDIFFLDINAAIAGDFRRDESGAWGFTRVGGSVEVALRF
jgi:hypothetical protein